MSLYSSPSLAQSRGLPFLTCPWADLLKSLTLRQSIANGAPRLALLRVCLTPPLQSRHGLLVRQSQPLPYLVASAAPALLTVLICGACAGCEGASGIGTSEKSSWPMARIVQVSDDKSVSVAPRFFVVVRTDCPNEADDADACHSILDEVWLPSTVESRRRAVATVVVGRLWDPAEPSVIGSRQPVG